MELAQRHGTLLHVLHLSTARELALFEDKPLCQKRITAEVCVHHLLFDDSDYARLGHLLKCNPAIKSREDRDALRRALAGNRLDVIGTDHAPHAWAEKQQAYPQAPAGLPLVQHALPALLELVREGWLSLATLVAKTSHRVAELFAIADRGFLREGYWADLVLVSELEHPALASAMPLLSRCNWTPFRHRAFHHRIDTTIVSGQLAWHAGRLSDDCQGLPCGFPAEVLSTACCGYPLAHGPSAGLSPPRQGRHRSPPRDRPSPASARRSRPPPRSSPCG